MKITIVCVGKVKEKYLRDAIAEYEKRLSRYCKLQVIEVADEKIPDGASTVVEDQIREKEAERILKNLRLDDPVVTLEITTFRQCLIMLQFDFIHHKYIDKTDDEQYNRYQHCT